MFRSIGLLRVLIIAVAAAFTVVPVLPASATTFPAEGYPGSDQVPVRCEKGQYLVGLRGRIGFWVDSLGPICAKALQGGLFGKRRNLALRGGKGGSPIELPCGPHKVITSFRIEISHSDRTLRGVIFTCDSIGNSDPEKHFFVPDRGHPPEWTDHYQDCPKGKVARGYQINYGKHVNGLGLICEQYVAASAPAEPPPMQAPPPPVQAAAGFAGVWDTVAAGHNITLILEVNGSDVSGYFGYSNDPQKDGNLRGTLQSQGEFLFTYQQNNGEAGSGAFQLGGNGKKIIGVASSNGVQVPWTGSRRP